MASVVQRLNKQTPKVISPPSFLADNIHYEVVMGSRAYGVNSSESTDHDIYGFCIPPKNIVFPHLAGVIPGFGYQGERFEQWQQAHIIHNKREYDFAIYNIVKYFQLCMENNPNMIDSLFVPETCVLHSTPVGDMVRNQKQIFLSKLIWKRFKGYAYHQLHLLENKKPVGKRKDTVEQYGYDVKYAYHVWRLIDEAYQALSTGQIDLLNCREELKTIRRGEWSETELRNRCDERIPDIERAFANSKLPERPDEQKIKALLLNCLEHHYGSLKEIVNAEDAAIAALRKIDSELQKIRTVIYS